MKKHFYLAMNSCLLLLVLLSTENNLLGMDIYKHISKSPHITIDGVPLNKPVVHPLLQFPMTCITTDDKPCTTQKNTILNKVRTKKARLLGGNDNDNSSIKKVLIATIGGFSVGFTCGIAGRCLATDPTGIITEKRNNFLIQNAHKLTPQEIVKTFQYTENVNQLIHVPITWPIAGITRYFMLRKYSDEYKWLSFSTACVGYIIGLVVGKKLCGAGIETEKSASFEIPGVVKVNLGGKISWK